MKYNTFAKVFILLQKSLKSDKNLGFFATFFVRLPLLTERK